MGNGAGTVCRGGWGGCRTGSARAGRPLRVREEAAKPGGPGRRWGPERREGRCLWGLLARGASPHLPGLLAPLLHISTFHASPPRMPNLAHAICRLSSEIGTRTKAERITSPQLPLHEERRGRDRGPRDKGQAANPQLSFLSSCSFVWPRAQVLGTSESGLAGPRGRTRTPILGRFWGLGQEVKPCCCPPG